jgi:hypothetical protein
MMLTRTQSIGGIRNLKHNQPNPTPLLIRLPLDIRPACHRQRPIIKQVIIQPPVSSAKLEILEENGIIEQREGIKHVEFEIVGEDEGILHECADAFLVGGSGVDGGVGGVVKEVCCTDEVVF